ncbi:MAG: hypothetical protein ACRDIY_17485 [Chloroflexota bacterium]
MSASVCPITMVDAPVDLIWRTLTATDSYGGLWDARVQSTEDALARLKQRAEQRTRDR